MKIILNEKTIETDYKTVFEVKEAYYPNADICIYNGFPIKENNSLSESDEIFCIQRGCIPDKADFEYTLVSRHTPGVHEKVKKACVGIAGLGGLGSNIAIQLSRIGIGKLILVDFDVVEPSNLNRQQYFINQLGMLKTEAMKEIILQINPYVEIETLNVFVDETNIKDIFEKTDIIVEAFDTPKSKATLINTVLSEMSDHYIIAASGLAGYFSNNTIKTKRISEHFYLIGDDTSEAKPGCGLMAPRASIAASHQANTVLRIIMGAYDV